MKKPPSMATRFQSSIAKTETADAAPDVRILFTDASDFSFRAVAGDPRPAVNGAAASMAQEFAGSVTKYLFLAAGVQLAFSDGSSCNLNFGKLIGALPV